MADNKKEHLIKFYPVGNGDTSQIILHNDKRILVDFFHSTDGENEDHPKIDLKKTLNDELKDANRDYFDVVIFTHGDEDHTKGSADFFEFDHAKEYQGNGRIKINMLYVPASMILESKNDIREDYRVIQAEARYRLKEGYGVLVFSKPDKLKQWLEKNNLSVEKRKSCIIDAGKCISMFSLEKDGAEFFVHSPYIKHVDENTDIQRNESAIILHATFKIENKETRYFLIGDSEYRVLEDIVDITENGKHKNEKRLEWDIYNIPHHCSYLVLNENGEKGDKETIPTKKVKKLLNYGNEDSIFISSSKPINKDYEQRLPPHIQAYNCYKRRNTENSGYGVLVTMEHPNEDKPEPIEIVIDKRGWNFSDFSEQEQYIENLCSRVNLTHQLKIDCEVSQDGFRTGLLRNMRFLQKDKKLRFFIERTNVQKPYDVKWKVKNGGREARKLNVLRGEITTDNGHHEKKEHTRYRGSHYVECYIIKNNVCVAMDKIEVPIEIKNN